MLERIVGYGLKLATKMEEAGERAALPSAMAGMVNLIGLGIASGGFCSRSPAPAHPVFPIPSGDLRAPAHAGLMERDGLLVLFGHVVNIGAWSISAYVYPRRRGSPIYGRNLGGKSFIGREIGFASSEKTAVASLNCMKTLLSLVSFPSLARALLPNIQDPPANDQGPTAKLSRAWPSIAFGVVEIIQQPSEVGFMRGIPPGLCMAGSVALAVSSSGWAPALGSGVRSRRDETKGPTSRRIAEYPVDPWRL